MRAAIYARVSTTDQNCELQLNELQDHIRQPRLGECRSAFTSSWTFR